MTATLTRTNKRIKKWLKIKNLKAGDIINIFWDGNHVNKIIFENPLLKYKADNINIYKDIYKVRISAKESFYAFKDGYILRGIIE